jgi:3-hydroxybutyryl-CoA dehydrogenase
MVITTVGVVGSGTMGAGIAQVAAQHGFQVLLYDIQEEIVNRSKSNIDQQLNRLADKGKLTSAEAAGIQMQIRTTVHLHDMRGCQLVIEAAPERMEIKQSIFRQLGEYCSGDTILATNTSSFSVTSIANATANPERVAGLHFFNPAPIMPLVEIIQGIRTSQDTIEALVAFSGQIQKTPVLCRDTPGFIVNRVARPFYNEALRILGDRVASVEQIDRIMKQAGLFRMGPFELQDMIGIDINYSTTESVYSGFFGDPRFRPHYFQQRMVQSGRLGKKSGEGYFAYDR